MNFSRCHFPIETILPFFILCTFLWRETFLSFFSFSFDPSFCVPYIHHSITHFKLEPLVDNYLVLGESSAFRFRTLRFLSISTAPPIHAFYVDEGFKSALGRTEVKCLLPLQNVIVVDTESEYSRHRGFMARRMDGFDIQIDVWRRGSCVIGDSIYRETTC